MYTQLMTTLQVQKGARFNCMVIMLTEDILTHRYGNHNGVAANSAAQIRGVGLAAAARARAGAEIALHSTMSLTPIMAVQGSCSHADVIHRQHSPQMARTASC